MYKLRRVTLLSVYGSAGMVNNLQNLINLVSKDQISVFLQEKKKILFVPFSYCSSD